MELVNELYAFSEQTVTGGPGRRADEDVEHAGEVERARDHLRGPRGDRSAGPDAVAVCAAHGRGALGAARPRAERCSRASWPAFDADVAKADEIVIPVQVNGKVRGRLTVPADTTDAELERLALADPRGAAHTRRQDGEEGGGGARAALSRSSFGESACAVFRRWPEAFAGPARPRPARRVLDGLWLRAGRPRLVSARGHPASSASRSCRTRAPSSTSSRSSPRRSAPSSSAAASIVSSRTRPAPTRC